MLQFLGHENIFGLQLYYKIWINYSLGTQLIRHLNRLIILCELLFPQLGYFPQKLCTVHLRVVFNVCVGKS